jgi:hypothetical protein
MHPLWLVVKGKQQQEKVQELQFGHLLEKGQELQHLRLEFHPVEECDHLQQR